MTRERLEQGSVTPGPGAAFVNHVRLERAPTPALPVSQQLTPTQVRNKSLNEGAPSSQVSLRHRPHPLFDSRGRRAGRMLAPVSLTHQGQGGPSQCSKAPSWDGDMDGGRDSLARPRVVILSPFACRLLSWGGAGAETSGGERRWGRSPCGESLPHAGFAAGTGWGW